MDIFATSIQIGTIAAILTQVIRLLPFIDQNDKQHKRLAAFVVTLVTVLCFAIYEKNIFGLGLFLETFLGSLITAYTVYKTVIQGLDEKIRLSIIKIKERAERNADKEISKVTN